VAEQAKHQTGTCGANTLHIQELALAFYAYLTESEAPAGFSLRPLTQTKQTQLGLSILISFLLNQI
jgi:hypothetical protein